jgi:toxin-antitoxin system PIN domain toxin
VIVDANVLIYAANESSPHHREAAEWLEEAFDGPSRVGLPWESLLAFQRIVTNPRVFESPMDPDVAWGMVRDWLGQDQAWSPLPGPRHADILGELIGSGNLRGKMIPDAHLAALAIEHGVGVCSFDMDFARFPELTWVRPGR